MTNQACERHTGADFLAFLRRLARSYPGGEVHVILDNVGTHKTPDDQAGLEKHRRIRTQLVLRLAPSRPWMGRVALSA